MAAEGSAVTLVSGLILGAIAGFFLGSWVACGVLAWGVCRAAARGDERIRREPFVPTAECLQEYDQ